MKDFLCDRTVRKGRLYPIVLTVLVVFTIFIITILYGQDYFSRNYFDDHHILQPQPQTLIKSVGIKESKKKDKENGSTRESEGMMGNDQREKMLAFAVGKGEEGCDIFNGKWVRDEKNKPIYEEEECPYIQPQLTCQEHGRPDKEYQFWQWKPHSCDLPKFNATLMLEALRGKRMLFVGDSLNRGQFTSMVCLLHRLVPKQGKSMNSSYDSLTLFQFKDYNATIEFYWAPFLLESNSDDVNKHRISHPIVRKNSINTHGKYWKGADVVVFNTYLWWTSAFVRILKGSFNDEVQEIEELSTEEAYRMAMRNIVKWVETNMNPKTTRVFFTSMSPTHKKSIKWGGEPGGNCYNETTMIENPNYLGLGSKIGSIMRVIDEEFSKSKVPISFLNITKLSNIRKEAHIQIYKKQRVQPTPEQLANPKSYADCVHWCLPGLQDTWNELLFAKLFYP